MTTETPYTADALDAPVTRRRARPIIWWAVVGVAALAVQISAFAGWIVSGDAKSVPTGPTPVPLHAVITVRFLEIGGTVATVAVLWYFVIRPWRRAGHVTTDGLLCLSFLTLVWQTSTANYFQPWFTYNAAFINLGSWDAHILGWVSPNANLHPEPIIHEWGAWLWGWFFLCVIACWVMNKARQRWPAMGTLALLGTCFATFMVIYSSQVVMKVLGNYQFPGSPRWATLFPDKSYSISILQWLLIGISGTALACIRYFKNDKGETIPERGLDRIDITGSRRSGLQFLAVVGAVNAAVAVFYSAPLALIGLYSDPWPSVITDKSYFVHGTCGPGTDYACPSPRIPMPRPRSLHVDPGGKLSP